MSTETDFSRGPGGAFVVFPSFGVSAVCNFGVLEVFEIGGDVTGSVLLLAGGFIFMVGGVGGVGFVGKVGVCINKTPFSLISGSIVSKINEACTSLKYIIDVSSYESCTLLIGIMWYLVEE